MIALLKTAACKEKLLSINQVVNQTVVWNPWEQKTSLMKDMEPQDYLDMLCVETANAATNAVTVNAGETHTMSVVYALERF